MKKIKKLLSVILVATMVFTTFSIGITASAESATAENSTTADSPLEVVVTTNESDYGKFDVAEITVTVTNTSDETVENVSAQAVFNDLVPVDSLYSELSKKAETLEPGKNFSFSYKAILNYKNPDVGFFSKIILWFVWLFNDGYTIVNSNSEADIENVTEIKFGKVSADNTIKISYDKIDYNIDEIIELSTNVSTEISEFRKSDEYKNATVEEKVTLMGDFLHSLQNNGKIKNVKYNASSCVYKYELYNGWKYGIVINNKHNDCWSSPNAINQRELDLNLYSNKSSISQNDAYKNRWEFLFDDIPSNDNISYRNMHNLFDFYSDNLIDTSIGFSTGMTVNVYKNLTGNKLIYIMSHGNFDGELPLIITTEKATEQKQRDYSLDYDRGDIEIWDFGDEHSEDLRFIIRPSIFENNYKNNELNGCIVFLSCCGAFGMDNQENYAFSESLKKAGASTIIGFCNSVNEVYSAVFYEKILQLLSSGNTVYEAYNNARNLIGYNQNIFIKNYTNENLIEEFPAYPIFSGERNAKLFDNSFNSFGSCTISIKDNVNNQSIKDVYAFAISDLKTLGFTSIAKSEENGVLTITAPAGKYYCDLTTDNYESKQIEIVIEADVNKVLFDPVYLTRKTSTLSGTVKDETTGNAISGVKVEFIDNSSDSLDPVATATTDTNGLFSVKLPYGSYSLSFNHDSYEYYGTTVNVDTENVVLTNPVLLTPKNSSGGGSEDDRTIIDSGDCGADGDNVTWTLYDDGELVISGNGAMADYSSSSKVPWYSVRESITRITIRKGITYIGNYVFSNCSNIESVIIPDSVINIGRYSFSNCRNLKDLIIPDSVTTIGLNSFSYCKNLANIKIPNNIKTIPNWAFSYTGLVDVVIPENIETIGGAAFYGCEQLETVKISNGVKTIGSAYTHSNSLECYYGTFENCKKLVQITIPESVTTIGIEAFANCTSLESIVIPDSVTSVGDGMFFGCSALKNIVLSKNIKKLAESYYYSWNSASNYSTRYYYGFFEGCINLSEIIIPESVTKIGIENFAGCTSLKNIIIPDSVTSIGGGSFYSCSSLENIKLSNNLKELSYSQYGKSGGIWNGFFELCSSLETVIIPEGVTTIDSFSFKECSNLKSITIPNSVTKLGQDVFYNCYNLNTVIISDNITKIPYGTFYNCSSLLEVRIPNNILSIDERSFKNCRSIKELKIPDSVTSIGHNAFYDCINLADIDIGNNTQHIGKDAFYNTAYYNDSSNWDNGILYIETVIIDAQIELSGCVSIRHGTTIIADSAFAYCRKITQINIPETVTKISFQAFYECDMLECITIPPSVSTIEGLAFSCCNKLSNIIILNPNCEIIDSKGTICNYEQIASGYYYNGKISGYSNSTAEVYATKYKMTFVALD